MVDFVTEEAQYAGENAALYAQGKLSIPIPSSDQKITILPGENVGYVVPERIDDLSEEKVVKFSYRVKNPRSNIRTQLISDGKIIYTRRHKFVLPSEMISIRAKLKPEDVKHKIIVNVIEKEQTVNVIERSMMMEEI